MTTSSESSTLAPASQASYAEVPRRTACKSQQGSCAHEILWQRLSSISHGNGTALREAIDARCPLVLSDLAANWPALERWTPERLSDRYGERIVRVYDASFGAPGRGYMGSIDTMSFADFLEATQSRGRDLRMFLYNLSRQIPELLNDIHLPDVGLRFSHRFVFSFSGCRGATTPLHYDIDMGTCCTRSFAGVGEFGCFHPRARRACTGIPLLCEATSI